MLLDYIDFEKNVLLKHNRLNDYIKLNDTEVLYTFDFSDMETDWMHLINGRYSKMNPTIKRKIRDHFDKNGSNYMYMDSFLFPEKYFNIYSELLGVNEEVLKKYSEHIDILDLEENVGACKALNLGVYNAQYDKILLVNDDNVFPQHWDTILEEEWEVCNKKYRCE